MFQALTNEIKPIPREYVLIFFYDILIYSQDWETHMKHFTEVLQVLLDNKLLANQLKRLQG